MLRQHLAQIGALRRDVSEFLQRRERVVDLTGLLHPLGVLDEVVLRLGNEALGRVEFCQLQIRRLPRRGVAQHLVAHSDSVVVEPQLGVLIHGLVVIVGRATRILQLDAEIADAVIDGEVGIRLVLIIENVEPDLYGLSRIFGLETLRFLFELLNLGHWSTKISERSRRDKPNLLSRRRLRRLSPSNKRLPASLSPPPL